MKIVEKPWGREVWIAHTEDYAMKIIEVKAGTRASLQYHKVKREHIYVDQGQVRFELENADGQMEVGEYGPGTVFEVVPGRKHRVTALQDTRLLEVSTPQLDDVVRVEDDFGRKP
jgi:mannose-6-phosphate isomerase